MDLCNTYSNLAECAMTLQNTYDLKFIILSLFMIMSISMIIFSYKMKIKNNFQLWVKLFTMMFGTLYLAVLPLMTLTLKHSVDFELFVLVLTSIYFIGLVAVLGGALLFGTKLFFNLFGLEAFDIKEAKKYKSDKYN